MQIWKYPLEIRDEQSIKMPGTSAILAVQVQNGTPCLWVMVDPRNPGRFRKIAIYGTGHEMSQSPYNYIGTFQVANGSLVFHVFDLGERMEAGK